MRVSTLQHSTMLILHSNFLHPFDQNLPNKPRNSTLAINNKVPKCLSITCSTSSPIKSRRDPCLDKHVTKTNKLRFVGKLTTLLLSKPKHFMRIHILCKCRAYLSLSKPASIIDMIHRYPAIFELFHIPTPRKPLNAVKPLSQLCVRLTPAAEALACKEIDLKREMRDSLALKLQKLLMMASHHRLLLSKLVHLGPDLGLPVNFRSRLCNEYPDKFKIVDTSYGRALELVLWDENLAHVLPRVDGEASRGLIVDRPLKFKQLRLRKGYNVKRSHQEYLLNFKELPDVCPYRIKVEEMSKESTEAEKRACAVVRELLGMTVEKRTLVDHITHFRKEFGLPNRLRAMLVRHPELFYVSLKGKRDSVFLVEGYDDKGNLLEKDGSLVLREQLMELVREGKQMRREHRKQYSEPVPVMIDVSECEDEDDDFVGDYHDDDLEELFFSEDFSSEDDSILSHEQKIGELWTTNSASILENENTKVPEPW
ncbi:hypothetical protein LIER_21800 [Lithospermum erythrorhizon]|uniref:PORR domain-containing protein n=1 Tax=Lithospermum erythrorhizon TaxID=34254 RepID=A0AAV3QSK1_LITER